MLCTESSGPSQAAGEDEAQADQLCWRQDGRLSCGPGRCAVRWQGLEKVRRRGGGERGTSIFALAELLAS